MTPRFHVFAASLFLGGCSASPTEPTSASGPLRLEAAIAQPALAVGDTTAFVVRLINTGAQPVTLTFGSGCQVLPYIRAADSDRMIYPTGGGWVCTTALSALTIPGRGEHVARFLLRGGSPQLAVYTGVPLGAGRYLATAEVHSAEYQLRSDPVAVTVR